MSDFSVVRLPVRDSQKDSSRAITRNDAGSGLSERTPPDDLRQSVASAVCMEKAWPDGQDAIWLILSGIIRQAKGRQVRNNKSFALVKTLAGNYTHGAHVHGHNNQPFLACRIPDGGLTPVSA